MYEVEIKVEINSQDKETVISSLINQGFSEKGTLEQTDCYVEAEKSPHGGYDLKRYRNENGKVFYTQKTWEMNSGELARKEIENESTLDEMSSSIEKSIKPTTIRKVRKSLEGVYNGTKMHVDIDSIKFDHSPDMRYFIEAEIITANKEEVRGVKEIIREFLKELLGKSELTESPGMFTMAFEKK
jgi:predicted adenylyl cyclase CyaB